MEGYTTWKGSTNKHSFADAEIEVSIQGCLAAYPTQSHWDIFVSADVWPSRSGSPLRRKTATDTADHIDLDVDFPFTENEEDDPAISAARSGGLGMAYHSYSRNPFAPPGQRWWQIWRSSQSDLLVRYHVQVGYRADTYAFSGVLAISPPT